MFSPHLVTGVHEKIDQFCTTNLKKRIFNGQKCNLITGILFLVNAFMIEKRYCAALKLGLFMFPQMHFSFELRSYQITHHFEGVFSPSIFFMNPKKATPNSSSKQSPISTSLLLKSVKVKQNAKEIESVFSGG